MFKVVFFMSLNHVFKTLSSMSSLIAAYFFMKALPATVANLPAVTKMTDVHVKHMETLN